MAILPYTSAKVESAIFPASAFPGGAVNGIASSGLRSAGVSDRGCQVQNAVLVSHRGLGLSVRLDLLQTTAPLDQDHHFRVAVRRVAVEGVLE